MTKITNNLSVGNKNTLGLTSILVLLFIVIVTALSAGFGGFMLGTKTGDEWQQKYIEFEFKARMAQVYADSLDNEVKKLVVFADSVSDVANRQTRQLVQIRQESAQVRVENESLYESVMAGLVDDPCNCDPVVELAEKLNLEIQQNLREIEFLYQRDQSRQVEIQTLRSALEVQTARADSLAVVVDNIPAPRGRTRILGFLEINRKEASLIGLIAGIVIGGIAL